MYKAHFKLQSNPFSPTPPPDFIFQSKELKEALAHFSFALENREAFLLLTGEVGTGKTTAVQSVLRLLPEGTPVALVTHTTLNPRELLEEVALRFGLSEAAGKSKPVLLRELEEHFENQWAEGRQSLLILDEAHLLKPDVLEEVRLLSNLEREGGKLVQICLVGQPELIAHLQRPELRQLRQRISVRYSLRPLSHAETREYVYHRLGAAGSPAPESVFSEAALTQIHQLTHGIPREINVIAGQSLLNAFVAGSAQVLPEHVNSVHEDFGFEGLRQVKSPAQGRQPSPPPPVTRLRPHAETGGAEEPPAPVEPQPPRPGLKQRPIPLPPEHLRPDPRPGKSPSQSSDPPPAPVAMPPQGRPAPQAKGEPVAIKQTVAPRKRSSSGGVTWIPWVLLIAVGLFLAWKYWASPFLEQDENSPQETSSGNNPAAVPALIDSVGGETADRVPTGERRDTAGGGAISEPVPANRGDTLRVNAEETGLAAGAPGTANNAAARDTVQSAGSQQLDWDERFLVDPRVAGGGGGPLTAQVASMRSREQAERLIADIQSLTGRSGTIVPSRVGEDQWFRVLVGRFQSLQEVKDTLIPVLRRKLITEVMIIPLPRGGSPDQEAP